VNTTDIPQQSPEAVARTIDGELFIMNAANQELHALSEVGARVWELADGKRDVAGIVDAIVDEYEVERARAEEDVLAFLEILIGKELIAIS